MSCVPSTGLVAVERGSMSIDNDLVPSSPGATGAGLDAVSGLAPHADTNNLMGFYMVWAVTQDTVNSQLEWLQLCGVIPDAAQIGDLSVEGLAIGGDGQDRATIAP